MQAHTHTSMSAHVRVPLSTCADKGATFAQWREAVLCVRLFFFPAQGKCKVLANVSGAPSHFVQNRCSLRFGKLAPHINHTFDGRRRVTSGTGRNPAVAVPALLSEQSGGPISTQKAAEPARSSSHAAPQAHQTGSARPLWHCLEKGRVRQKWAVQKSKQNGAKAAVALWRDQTC